MFFILVLLTGAAFVLSASAGMGGSLLLVPGMVLILGIKKGVAVAAILLACNNVGKVLVYRRVIPWRAAAVVLVLTVAGAAIGATLLTHAPSSWVGFAVFASIAASLLLERSSERLLRRASSPPLAFLSGATSGFSGTSGPLKGISLRNLGLDRQQLVGAASIVSLAGDTTKASVFLGANLFTRAELGIVLAAVPLVPLASLLGRRINRRLGERGYALLFWGVMAGYALRLALA